MVERRETWGYWVFNESPIWIWGLGARPWITITHLPRDRYINFACFQYKIDGKLFKEDSSEFQNAIDKDIMWDKLNKG